MVCVTFYSIGDSQFLLGAFSAVFSLFLYLVWLSHPYQRLVFPSALLNATSVCLRTNFVGAVCTMFVMVILQVTWITFSVAAVYQVIVSTSSGGATVNSATMTAVFGVLLCALWGCQFIRALTQTIFAGVVATWAFQPDHPYPIFSAIYRAVFIIFSSVSTYAFFALAQGPACVFAFPCVGVSCIGTRCQNKMRPNGSAMLFSPLALLVMYTYCTNSLLTSYIVLVNQY